LLDRSGELRDVGMRLISHDTEDEELFVSRLNLSVTTAYEQIAKPLDKRDEKTDVPEVKSSPMAFGVLLNMFSIFEFCFI
jgi:hypothetical protein